MEIQPGRVVSMTLSRSDQCLMTLLAFADGESVSEEQYFGDTFYYVIEGVMPISMEGRKLLMDAGECLMVPAGVAHAIGGTEPDKMQQITVQS